MKPWSHLDTGERIAAIKSAWQAGMSASDIAHALASRFGSDITRNMVIGYYTRYRAEMRQYPLLPANMSHLPKAKAYRPKPAPKTKRKRRKIPQMCDAPLEPPRSIGLTMLELKDFSHASPNQCRWAITGSDVHPSRHLFCGCETAPGQPYCDYHTVRSMGAGTASENIAYKTAMKEAA